MEQLVLSRTQQATATMKISNQNPFSVENFLRSVSFLSEAPPAAKREMSLLVFRMSDASLGIGEKPRPKLTQMDEEVSKAEAIQVSCALDGGTAAEAGAGGQGPRVSAGRRAAPQEGTDQRTSVCFLGFTRWLYSTWALPALMLF